MEDQEFFALNLTTQTKSHEEWLAVVKFGLGTLLDNQPLLAEILVMEAEREAGKCPNHKPSDDIAKIMQELDLSFKKN